MVREEDGDLLSEVMWIDHFGNCQLNVDPDDIDGWGDVVRLHIGEEWRIARRAHTYAEVGEGEIGLIIDSYGLLSVALDRRAADAELGMRTGSEIRIQRLADADARPGVTTAVSLGSRTHRGRPVMRPGTTIMLGFLLLLIIGAALFQLVILAG